MNANVIIYCRVSSDEQTLGASLDVQEERLRKYCNQMGYLSSTYKCNFLGADNKQ